MKKNQNISSPAIADKALYKPLKTPVTIRLDADVLAWFKAQGKGYLTRMNMVLREEMLDALRDTKDSK